jgi:MFS family permease
MNSLLGLWLSFIPDALLQHNFDVFKALLSEYHNDIELIEARSSSSIGDDSTTNESKSSASARSGSVGKLGMALGISFMIGPMIASVTSPTFQFAASFAIVCTIISGIVIFHLPMPKSSEVKNDKNVHDIDEQLDQVTENEFALTRLLKLQTPKSQAAMMLLVIRLSMALAYQFFNTIWPASLKSRFNFGPSDHARFMSFIGISYAFSQGFLAKRLVQFWGSDGKVSHYVLLCHPWCWEVHSLLY